MNRFHCLALPLVVICCVGCEALERIHSYSQEDALTVSTTATEPATFPGLKQVVAFHDDLLSGSKPEGEEGMDSLMKLGVDTIICVDACVIFATIDARSSDMRFRSNGFCRVIRLVNTSVTGRPYRTAGDGKGMC